MSSISTFLNGPTLESAFSDKSGSLLKAALSHTILALGAYLLGKESRPNGVAYNPQTQWNTALKLRSPFTRQTEFPLRYFQVFSH
jgi:hypothetical protein